MNRMDKVNQFLRKEISIIVQYEVKDPRLEFVTITHADVSRDLRSAKVYFSVLGDQEKKEAAQQGLNSAKGFIRKLVGERIQMRYTPEIIFVFDKSIEYSARIEEALQKIKEETQDRS